MKLIRFCFEWPPKKLESVFGKCKAMGRLKFYTGPIDFIEYDVTRLKYLTYMYEIACVCVHVQ